MPADHLDPLDPRFPIALTSEAPLFWSSLRPWWSHSSAFAMAESERTGKQAARREETFTRAVPPLGYLAGGRVYHPSDVTIVRPPPEDLPAVEFAPRPRPPYPPLAPDALAHEFAALPPDATLIEEVPL